MTEQGYINHLAFVLDRSTSMRPHKEELIEVVDQQVQALRDQADQDGSQEWRANVYQFGYEVENIYYDKDVLRLPTIRGKYRIAGNTALVDAVLKAIRDLRQYPQLYGNHAFLIYVLTDGEENASKEDVGYLEQAIAQMPDNWTLAAFVPNQLGKFHAQKWGIPAENIEIWNTESPEGIREVGRTVRQATQTYAQARGSGTFSGTKNLFSLDLSHLNADLVKASLTNSGDYRTFAVFDREEIASFVARVTGSPYKRGSAYYQHTKRETFRPYVDILIRNKLNGEIFAGHQARNLVGIPPYETRLSPGFNGLYDIFVQSGSTNRVLIPGSSVIVRV